MSNWFLFAIIGPVLWSIVNHIDKYMLSKYFKEKGVGALMVFSCLSSIIVLPFIIIFFHTKIFQVSFEHFLLLMSLGFLSAIAFYFYLKAVNVEEVSVVIPLFQLIPIFAYFLSNLILGESLTLNQIMASLLVMAGVVILSFEIDVENNFKFKKEVLFLVVISSFCFALNDTLFKKVAVVESFWISVFWQYFALALCGIFIIIFSKNFRKNFSEMNSGANIKILSLNLLSEILYMVGNLASNFATLLAPVAIVLVVGSYQPLFVFIGAFLLTIFLPKIVTEKISIGHFFHKLISILIIFIGSYLLYTASNF